nr:hypothetical protein [Abalone asfa-like virus]
MSLPSSITFCNFDCEIGCVMEGYCAILQRWIICRMVPYKNMTLFYRENDIWKSRNWGVLNPILRFYHKFKLCSVDNKIHYLDAETPLEPIYNLLLEEDEDEDTSDEDDEN